MKKLLQLRFPEAAFPPQKSQQKTKKLFSRMAFAVDLANDEGPRWDDMGKQ